MQRRGDRRRVSLGEPGPGLGARVTPGLWGSRTFVLEVCLLSLHHGNHTEQSALSSLLLHVCLLGDGGGDTPTHTQVHTDTHMCMHAQDHTHVNMETTRVHRSTPPSRLPCHFCNLLGVCASPTTTARGWCTKLSLCQCQPVRLYCELGVRCAIPTVIDNVLTTIARGQSHA